MPFIGVRISWLMVARKSDFAPFAASAASFAGAEVVGTLEDLLLEVLAVLREAVVAIADLAHHFAEARGEDADLVVALDRDRRPVIVALADARHRLA